VGQLGGDRGVVARHRHRQLRLVLDPAPRDPVADAEALEALLGGVAERAVEVGEKRETHSSGRVR